MNLAIQFYAHKKHKEINEEDMIESYKATSIRLIRGRHEEVTIVLFCGQKGLAGQRIGGQCASVKALGLLFKAEGGNCEPEQ